MFAVIIAVVVVIALIVVNELARVSVSNAVFTVKSHKIEVNVFAQGQSIASVVKSVKDWTLVDTSVAPVITKVEEFTVEANGHVVSAYTVENATAIKAGYGKISGNLIIWTITRQSDNKTVVFSNVAIGNDKFTNVEFLVRSKAHFNLGNVDYVHAGDQVVRVYNN